MIDLNPQQFADLGIDVQSALRGLEVPTDAFLAQVVVQPNHVSHSIPHVNNVQAVQWIDEIAQLHAKTVGWSQDRLAALDIMWFVSRHEVDYRAEAFTGEELTVATWVARCGQTSCLRHTIFVRAADQRLILRGASRWVLVNLRTRKPVRVPEPLALALQASCTPPTVEVGSNSAPNP